MNFEPASDIAAIFSPRWCIVTSGPVSPKSAVQLVFRAEFDEVSQAVRKLGKSPIDDERDQYHARSCRMLVHHDPSSMHQHAVDACPAQRADETTKPKIAR
jgi:hypothetical protein